MAEPLTKSRGRNIFYAGSLCFVITFVVPTMQSHHPVMSKSTAGMPLTAEVFLGKRVWERNFCIKCHTLHGEGACLMDVQDSLAIFYMMRFGAGVFAELGAFVHPFHAGRAQARDHRARPDKSGFFKCSAGKTGDE